MKKEEEGWNSKAWTSFCGNRWLLQIAHNIVIIHGTEDRDRKRIVRMSIKRERSCSRGTYRGGYIHTLQQNNSSQTLR